jgi:hypothetical protein
MLCESRRASGRLRDLLFQRPFCFAFAFCIHANGLVLHKSNIKIIMLTLCCLIITKVLLLGYRSYSRAQCRDSFDRCMK